MGNTRFHTLDLRRSDPEEVVRFLLLGVFCFFSFFSANVELKAPVSLTSNVKILLSGRSCPIPNHSAIPGAASTLKICVQEDKRA